MLNNRDSKPGLTFTRGSRQHTCPIEIQLENENEMVYYTNCCDTIMVIIVKTKIYTFMVCTSLQEWLRLGPYYVNE